MLVKRSIGTALISRNTVAVSPFVDDVGRHPVDRVDRRSIVGGSDSAELDYGVALLGVQLFGDGVVGRHGSEPRIRRPPRYAG